MKPSDDFVELLKLMETVNWHELSVVEGATFGRRLGAYNDACEECDRIEFRTNTLLLVSILLSSIFVGSRVMQISTSMAIIVVVQIAAFIVWQIFKRGAEARLWYAKTLLFGVLGDLQLKHPVRR